LLQDMQQGVLVKSCTTSPKDFGTLQIFKNIKYSGKSLKNQTGVVTGVKIEGVLCLQATSCHAEKDFDGEPSI